MSVDLNTLALLGIAAFQAVAAFFTWRTHETTKITRGVAMETQAIAKQTEVNSNSKMDLLLAANSKAEYASGHEDARLEAEAKAGVLAQGVTQGRDALK